MILRQHKLREKGDTMRRILFVTFMAVLAVSTVAHGTAWAGATVKVTREENKPDPVEVKVGEEVAFINATGGGQAHVSFEGNDAVQFNVGRGGSQVKFDKPPGGRGCSDRLRSVTDVLL